MNKLYKVYIDIDGVLADFDKKAKEITSGKYGRDDFSKGNFWKAVYRYNSEVEPFFESLPKMSGADKLMNFAVNNFENVALLTATGFTPKDAAEQKTRWAAKNFPGIKTLTVTNSAHKAVYSNPRSILIDDRTASIDPWRKAGGLGILFTNTDQAISELKTVLK